MAAADDTVEDVVALALELDDVALLEVRDVRVRARLVAELGDRCDKVLDGVVLVELLLRDQVLSRDGRGVSHRRGCAQHLAARAK